MRNDPYNLSGSSYIRLMDEKTSDYSATILQAQRLNRDMQGRPTMDEADCYDRAIRICEEIMNMNLSQRDVYNLWSTRKRDCERNYKRIADILAPPPPPAPKKEEKTISQTNSGKAAKQEKAPGTSHSGFTTQYASKDVPVEMIESWFKGDDCKYGFDRVVGRTELKERLMDEVASFGWEKLDAALDINPVKCYFLYGPPGTGKTHLIKALAYELKQKGFSFMHLVGSEVHDKHVGVAEKIVTTAFNVAIEKEPCLIFMDEIDNLCRPRGNAEGHEQRLTVSFLEAYNRFKESRKRVIFMGATNHPGNVDEAMLDRISLIKVPLPAEEDRIGYFDRIFQADPKTEKTALALEEGLTSQYMASVTDNCSYRDLDRVRDFMLIQLKAKAMKENLVLDENGNIDKIATDEQASQAIIQGKIRLTRELFDRAIQENRPSDKTAIRQELKEFEERASGVNI